MAVSTSLSIRVDADLKKDSEQVLAQLGVSTSTVVSMLLKTIVRNQSIPPELFTLNGKQMRNQAYMAKLQRSYDEYQAGLAMAHDIVEAENA